MNYKERTKDISLRWVYWDALANKANDEFIDKTLDESILFSFPIHAHDK